MSQSSIVRQKKSPCCIGCVILLVVVIGVIAALGIWGYRFVKDNMGFHDVAQLADPPLDVAPEVIFPATVGEFTRDSLNEPLTGSKLPNAEDLGTTAIVTARYSDAEQHIINAVAMSTAEAQGLRRDQTGPLTMGRGAANAPNLAISLKDPTDKQSTIMTWSKPNWTFMLHTTSTEIVKFLDDYKSVDSSSSATGEDSTTEPSDAETTTASPAVEADAPEAVETNDTQAATPEVTPAATPEGAPAATPNGPVATPAATEQTPDVAPQDSEAETTAPAS